VAVAVVPMLMPFLLQVELVVLEAVGQVVMDLVSCPTLEQTGQTEEVAAVAAAEMTVPVMTLAVREETEVKALLLLHTLSSLHQKNVTMAAYASPSTLVSSDASVCVGPGYAPGSINLKCHVIQAGQFAWLPAGVNLNTITPVIREITSLTTPIIATVNVPDQTTAGIYLLRAYVEQVTAAVAGVSAATYAIRFYVSAAPNAATNMTIGYMIGNVYTTAVP